MLRKMTLQQQFQRVHLQQKMKLLHFQHQHQNQRHQHQQKRSESKAEALEEIEEEEQERRQRKMIFPLIFKMLLLLVVSMALRPLILGDVATTTMTATETMTATTSTMASMTATATTEDQTIGDTPLTMMITNATAAKDKVLGELLITAFLLIRPFRISNSVMSSAMTRLSKIDTARLKITESLSSVLLEPDPTKELIPSDIQTPTPVDAV
jgi:hypothetical protein